MTPVPAQKGFGLGSLRKTEACSALAIKNEPNSWTFVATCPYTAVDTDSGNCPGVWLKDSIRKVSPERLCICPAAGCPSHKAAVHSAASLLCQPEQTMQKPSSALSSPNVLTTELYKFERKKDVKGVVHGSLLCRRLGPGC